MLEFFTKKKEVFTLTTNYVTSHYPQLNDSKPSAPSFLTCVYAPCLYSPGINIVHPTVNYRNTIHLACSFIVQLVNHRVLRAVRQNA